MAAKKLNKCIRKIVKLRRYNNIVESLALAKFMRKIWGMSVLTMETGLHGRIVTKFSWFGFIFFVVWYSLYFFCAYKAHVEDQTILQSIYSTKMQGYGDDFERILSFIFVSFLMWKVPFGLSGDSSFMQVIVDVDKSLEHLGEKVDYNIHAYSAILLYIGQLGVYSTRMLCIWLSLSNLNISFPADRMFQVVFSEALVLLVTAQYCHYLIILRARFKFINKVLSEIKCQNCWESKLFIRSERFVNIPQDKYICEKIKGCAKIYAMLCKASDVINCMFGLCLIMNFILCIVYIIFHIFYFMEATAACLFLDLPRYIYFLIYVFWQIGYATGIIFLTVSFCERTMSEARDTSLVTHEIVNGDSSSLIKAEAMQLSMQLVHQRPVFTACGVYQLNYPLFLEGVQIVSSYLIILFQFVMKSNDRLL